MSSCLSLTRETFFPNPCTNLLNLINSCLMCVVTQFVLFCHKPWLGCEFALVKQVRVWPSVGVPIYVCDDHRADKKKIKKSWKEVWNIILLVEVEFKLNGGVRVKEILLLPQFQLREKEKRKQGTCFPFFCSLLHVKLYLPLHCSNEGVSGE